jgi:hypothetical protein
MQSTRLINVRNHNLTIHAFLELAEFGFSDGKVSVSNRSLAGYINSSYFPLPF